MLAFKGRGAAIVPISYPHIRTLAEAAAHNAVGFAASELEKSGGTVAAVVAKLEARFPGVPISAIYKIVGQGVISQSAAQTMQGTHGGPALPGSQLGVNPASPTAFEYIVDVNLVIRPRRGPARVRTYRMSIRSGVALDPDTVTLRAEVMAEEVASKYELQQLGGGAAVTVSSTIVQASVRGQI